MCSDEDIKSSSTKEHRTMSPEEESMKLRRAKEASELSSTQMEAKIKQPSSTNTWRSFSTHSESATKKNQPKRIPYEEVIEDTKWQIFNGREGDIQSLIESFRPNQDEPSYKSNFFGFLTHQRKTENWIRDQIRFGLGVMDFTNQLNRNLPDLDKGALIEGFRANQTELSCESTCSEILTQPGRSSNLIHSITDFGLKVIELLKQKILSLPYLEAHGFNQLQTRLWRPGEYLLQLESPKDISRFIHSHWIMIRFNSFTHQHLLPYMEPITPSPLQRLYSEIVKLKKTARRLSDHGIILKISRYKSTIKLPLFGNYTNSHFL